MATAYKAPGIRTSRTQAEDIGTDPAGLTDTSYDPAAGHPPYPGLGAGHYVEQPPKVGGTVGPIDADKSFAVKE